MNTIRVISLLALLVVCSLGAQVDAGEAKDAAVAKLEGYLQSVQRRQQTAHEAINQIVLRIPKKNVDTKPAMVRWANEMSLAFDYPLDAVIEALEQRLNELKTTQDLDKLTDLINGQPRFLRRVFGEAMREKSKHASNLLDMFEKYQDAQLQPTKVWWRTLNNVYVNLADFSDLDLDILVAFIKQ